MKAFIRGNTALRLLASAASAIACFSGAIQTAQAQTVSADLIEQGNRYGYTPGQARVVNATIAGNEYLSQRLADQGGTIAAQASEIQRLRRIDRERMAQERTSAAERAELQANIERLNTQYANLVSALAQRDIEVAAYRDTLAVGVVELLARDDPRISQALENYEPGDSARIQELVRLTHRARDAAYTKQKGNELRLAAAYVQSDSVVGKRTGREALDAWLEAAESDPDNFSQWVTIHRLARRLFDKPIQTQARANVTRLVTDDMFEQASALDLFDTMDEARAAGLDYDEATPQRAKLSLYRQHQADKPDEAVAAYLLVGQLIQTVQADTSRFQFRNQENAMSDEEAIALLGEAEGLLVSVSGSFTEFAIQELEHSLNTTAAPILLRNGQPELGQRAYRRAAEIARSLVSKRPDDLYLQTVAAQAVQNLAFSSTVSEEERLELLAEAIALSERAFSSDPDQVTYGVSAWHSHTGLGLSAIQQGKYDIAISAFRRALEIGMAQPENSEQTYMRALTYPRLAGAYLATRRFDLARETLQDAIALAEHDGRSSTDPTDRFLALLDLVDIDAIEGTISHHGPYDAVIAQARNAAVNGQIDSVTLFSIEADVLSRIAAFDLQRQDYPALLSTIDALGDLVAAHPLPDARQNAVNELALIGNQMLAVDLPGAEVTWGDIDVRLRQLAATGLIDGSNAVLIDILLPWAEQSRSLGPAADLNETVARIRAALNYQDDLFQTDTVQDRARIIAAYLTWLSNMPGSGITTQTAYDYWRQMARYSPDQEVVLQAIAAANRLAAQLPDPGRAEHDPPAAAVQSTE